MNSAGVKIHLNDVSKYFYTRFGTVKALEKVNCTVKAGEFFVIIGPSGCGKTTLLRIMAGLESRSAGEILVSRETPHQPLTAMVFQENSIFPWMTVEANIGYGMKNRGAPAGERERVVKAYIEKVGLTTFARAYPHELSGGMKQRVSVARAFAANPEVLLMDEPFGSLDEQTRAVLQEELLRIWEETRKTVIFITHSIDEAVLMGDRILVMSAHPGRVKSIVDVPFSRPRRVYEIRKEPGYGELVFDLWNQLQADIRQGAPQPQEIL